jgi:outer membrane biosynthesis protein TonB
VRWAGYGLNEAVIATVRQLHFRPALRDGQPVPIRVLLRYNFRRPARESER